MTDCLTFGLALNGTNHGRSWAIPSESLAATRISFDTPTRVLLTDSTPDAYRLLGFVDLDLGTAFPKARVAIYHPANLNQPDTHALQALADPHLKRIAAGIERLSTSVTFPKEEPDAQPS